jgi:protein tyrosine phosphatase (PTP) superfamily phosphohydrolase (DUF442 family)
MYHAPTIVPIHENLTTSGLPAPEDFAHMAQEGYEIVIAVRHPDDAMQLAGEEELVAQAGMAFFYIPMRSQALTPEGYEMLRDALRTWHDRKIWLHCTKNRRIATLMYVFNIIERSLPVSEAKQLLHAVWEPDAPRQAFIDEALEKYAYQYL